jgi:hypothetical protein
MRSIWYNSTPSETHKVPGAIRHLKGTLWRCHEHAWRWVLYHSITDEHDSSKTTCYWSCHNNREPRLCQDPSTKQVWRYISRSLCETARWPVRRCELDPRNGVLQFARVQSVSFHSDLWASYFPLALACPTILLPVIGLKSLQSSHDIR